MTLKRARLIGAACIVAIIVLLALAKCMPTEVSADPMGPPTIETYLQNIQAGMIVLKWALGIVGGIFTAFICVVIYAYKRDIAEVKKDAEEAKASAGDAFKEINTVKRLFISTENHDRSCPHRNPTVEAGH